MIKEMDACSQFTDLLLSAQRKTYPEMAHTYAVILFFIPCIEFQRCLLYSKNRFDFNMHLS